VSAPGNRLSVGSVEESEMLRAATSISRAMSEFVAQAVKPPPLPLLDTIMALQTDLNLKG